MTSTANYTQMPYSTTPITTWVNWIDALIESNMIKHEDIPVFNFRKLNQIRQILQETGYSTREIEGTISGLSELPEYASQSKTNKTGREKSS